MKSPESSGRKEIRRDQRRKDILEAANRLFSTLGYENVTLRAIAEEMGHTHATLYRYFPDKSNLLEELCRETFALLAEEFDAIAATSPDPEDCLLQTSRGLIRFGLTHPQHFRIVFFGPEDRNGIRAGEYIDAIGTPLFERLVKVFAACSRSSGLNTMDPVLDAHAWWHSIFGLTMVLIIQGDIPHVSAPERIAERSIKILWAGLKALSQEPEPSS